MEKMTKREFMEAVIKEMEYFDPMEERQVKIRDFAIEEIIKLDKALTKRREKMSEKTKENELLIDKIYDEILKEDEAVTATIVGEYMEISKQKASVLLRKLVEQKRATVEDVKINKRMQKGYKKSL